jgi:hypothetical protein
VHQNDLIDDINPETPTIDFGEYVKDPRNIVKLIKEFYDNTLKITVNYNQHTLFLWMIGKITRRYLETAYPEFKEEEKFEELKSIVGLEKYFVPEIEEKTENDRNVKTHLHTISFHFINLTHLHTISFHFINLILLPTPPYSPPSQYSFYPTLQIQYSQIHDLTYFQSQTHILAGSSTTSKPITLPTRL